MNGTLKDPSKLQHELRSPLTAIMGMLALLDKSPLTTEQRHYLQNISLSAKRLLLLANSLSTASAPLVTNLKKVLPTKLPRILMVEDCQIIQFIHKKMLQELNCQVDTASNAKQALAMTSSRTYDLILLDIGLPDKTGIEVARELRQRERFQQQTLIVALTAFVEDSVQKQCLEAGINQILHKPIDIESLRALLP